jgi:hypothetical protein
MGPRFLLAVALSAALACVASAAEADSPGATPPPATADDRGRAAARFDEGVARFQRAEFADAARAFDEADVLGPSPVAISNAIAAAKRAGDHLHVARLAERALARGAVVVEAREALAEAATHLCRLDLSCDAMPSTPCTISLDGEPTTTGAFVLPGTHQLGALSGAQAAEERLVCAAGARYRIALGVRTSPLRDAPPGSPGPAAGGGLHPAAFFAGAAVTAVLAGVTVWSGLDALAAKRALPLAPTQPEETDVLGRARRTDYLLLGAGVAGLGTAALGLFGTTWHRAPVAAALVPSPAGAMLVGSWTFR